MLTPSNTSPEVNYEIATRKIFPLCDCEPLEIAYNREITRQNYYEKAIDSPEKLIPTLILYD